MRLISKARRRGTPKMLLNDPDSGVPVASNAANLEIFMSPDGANQSAKTWTADRGDAYFDFTASTDGADEAFQIESDGTLLIAAQGVHIMRGSLFSIAPTDDMLVVVTGRHTRDDEGLATGTEPGSLTFRLGMVDGATFRVRSFPVTPIVGDQIVDDSGDYEDGTKAPATSLWDRNGTNNDDHTYTMIAAWDRNANTWSQVTYDHDDVSYDDDKEADPDTTAVADTVTLQTNDEAEDDTTSSGTIHGRFHGAGVWKFSSNSLPSDWKQAGIQMGIAWANGNYTFWPAWGKE